MSSGMPYIRLLNLVRQTRTTTVKQLTHAHEELLAYIADATAQQRPLKITDLVYLKDFGTGQTISNKVTFLIEQGYLKQTPDPEDKRIKLISLTEKAYTLFESRDSYIRTLCTDAK